MDYKAAFDRNQMMMTTWDALVHPESTARLIDAFVDSLDLSAYDFKKMASQGRPPYNPKSLLKLYIYGNEKGIKSSRRLAEACRTNIEVLWMTGCAEPDFRTISDFRKENIDGMKKIFHAFNQRLSGAVEWGFLSIDGSKFSACNSKNNNFTKNKLDDRIKWLNCHVEEYLRILDDMDKQEDMVRCLEDGIIPHVITDDGKDGYELEISFEEAEADVHSTEPEELKKALHAGVIPEAYKDVLSDMEVKEVRRKVSDEPEKENAEEPPYGTEEEMRARAEEGYFVRDPERNLVYCPGGEILRQKCIKKNGNIRYANKNACRHCPNRNKCYKGKNEWKEIDFTKDCLEKPCREWLKAEGKEPDKKKASRGKYHFEKKKVVCFFLKPDRKKTAERMCLSEHPFGTIKRAMGFTYFLLKGLKKVEGEFALMCLGYNIKRAKNLLGFEKMMELMAGGNC